MNVLVIDDEILDVAHFEDLAQQTVPGVAFPADDAKAYDDIAAWDIIDSGFIPDVVLVDIALPGGREDGIRLIGRLAKDRRLHNTCIIGMTAASNAQQYNTWRAASLKAGAADFILKGSDDAKFTAILARCARPPKASVVSRRRKKK